MYEKYKEAAYVAMFLSEKTESISRRTGCFPGFSMFEVKPVAVSATPTLKNPKVVSGLPYPGPLQGEGAAPALFSSASFTHGLPLLISPYFDLTLP